MSGGPLRLCGTTLGRHRHICTFFHSPDDHYRILLPFIKDGFDAGEKAVHIIDPRRRAQHVQRLTAIGIGVTAAQEDGRLDMREWADAHLRDGSFDRDRTHKMIEGIRERSAAAGFPRTRFVTHMVFRPSRRVPWRAARPSQQITLTLKPPSGSRLQQGLS